MYLVFNLISITSLELFTGLKTEWFIIAQSVFFFAVKVTLLDSFFYWLSTSYLPLMRLCPLLSAWCSRCSLYEIELQTPQANQTKPSLYLCAGTASVAIKHAQQHSSCLQTCCRTSSIFYRCVCWQLIALKTHHR